MLQCIVLQSFLAIVVLPASIIMQRHVGVNQAQQYNLQILAKSQEIDHWRLSYNRAINEKAIIQNNLDQRDEDIRKLRRDIQFPSRKLCES